MTTTTVINWGHRSGGGGVLRGLKCDSSVNRQRRSCPPPLSPDPTFGYLYSYASFCRKLRIWEVVLARVKMSWGNAVARGKCHSSIMGPIVDVGAPRPPQPRNWRAHRSGCRPLSREKHLSILPPPWRTRLGNPERYPFLRHRGVSPVTRGNRVRSFEIRAVFVAGIALQLPLSREARLPHRSNVRGKERSVRQFFFGNCARVGCARAAFRPGRGRGAPRSLPERGRLAAKRPSQAPGPTALYLWSSEAVRDVCPVVCTDARWTWDRRPVSPCSPHQLRRLGISGQGRPRNTSILWVRVQILASG